MGLEVGLFFKKRPTERCEMLGTRPRRMASSAISRWLQWLIGPLALRRLLACHRNHRADLLGRVRRGRSRSRRIGQPLETAALVGRLAATACANTAPSSATHRVPVRSRARPYHRPHAGSCGRAAPTAAVSNGFVPAVPAPRAVRAKHSPDRRLIGALQPPVSAPGFVMPQHSRFDSCFVPENQLSSAYLRASVSTGVTTFARLY